MKNSFNFLSKSQQIEHIKELIADCRENIKDEPNNIDIWNEMIEYWEKELDRLLG